MDKRLFFLVCVLLLMISSLQSKAQDSISDKLPLVNVSWGIISYKGDVSSVQNVGEFYNPTFAIDAGLQYVFWNTLGLKLHGFYGIASLEQSTLGIRHNFRTTMVGGGLSASFHFDNGFMMKKGSKLAPFIFGGVMPIAYFPYGDLKGKNGEDYYYWSDGSIRNVNEISINAPLATTVTRDYDYELSYRSRTDFSTIALSYSAGIGASFYINNWLSAQLKVSYSFTNTDYLDGLKMGSSNDGFYFGNIGFTINPNVLLAKSSTKEPKEKEEKINVDDFLTLDTDADGVPDLSDKCSGTPSGTKVNAEGCPEKPRMVDPSEIDSMAMMPDSLIVLRETLCANYPILCGESDREYPDVNERSKRKKKKKNDTKKTVVTESSMKEIIEVADSNKDGKVELPELYDAIEKFFDQEDKLSLPDLRKLIDYFFEQY